MLTAIVFSKMSGSDPWEMYFKVYIIHVYRGNTRVCLTADILTHCAQVNLITFIHTDSSTWVCLHEGSATDTPASIALIFKVVQVMFSEKKVCETTFIYPTMGGLRLRGRVLSV